jgi:hypothetical protein
MKFVLQTMKMLSGNKDFTEYIESEQQMILLTIAGK